MCVEQVYFCVHNQLFYSLYKVGRNGSIGVKGFSNSKKVISSGMQEIITGLGKLHESLRVIMNSSSYGLSLYQGKHVH